MVRDTAEGTPTRRRLLRTVAAGGTVGLAGCGDADAPVDDSADDGADDSPAATPTPGADPDRPFLGEGPTVGLEPVAAGLTYPTDLASPPGDDRLFVTDQLGSVYVIDGDERREEPFIDVSDHVVDVGLDSLDGFDERGLLGIAFHPEYESNGRLYLRYSRPAGPDAPDGTAHTEALVEFTADEDREHADPDAGETVLEIPQPFFVHNSGAIHFGPDGYLYVTTGDGGGSFEDRPADWYDDNHGDPAQITEENLLGGVLRIDVDADDEGTPGPYGIPEDNPLVDEEGHRDEYYAWGFRNPWGAAFDGDEFYVADVGEVMFETVNRVERGGNYGWNVREGTHCFDTGAVSEPPADCPDRTPDDVRGGEPLLDPVIEYPQRPADVDDRIEDVTEQMGSAVIGGAVSRGDAVPELDGEYVFGDWSAVPHGEPAGSLFVASPPDDDSDEGIHPYYAERDLWPIRTLRVEATDDVADDGELRRYVAAIGEADDDLYVLTANTSAIEGDTGAVHRIVDADRI